MNLSQPVLAVLLSMSGGGEFPVVQTPEAKPVPMAPGSSSPELAGSGSGASAASAAASLLSLVRSSGACYDGSDQAVHGTPMCAVALSNDPSAPYYVMIYLQGRGHQESGDMTLHRSMSDGSISIVTDSGGGIISATRTKTGGQAEKLSVLDTRAELEAAAAAVKTRARR